MVVERDRYHVKKVEAWKGHRKPKEWYLKFSAQYGCRDELMRWLICLAFMQQLCFYGDLDYE